MAQYERCEGAIWETKGWHEAEKGAADRLCVACRKVMVEAEAKKPTSWELFAMQRDDHFEHFYPSTIQLTMCGHDPMFLVRLILDENGPYWGWYHSFHPSNRSDKGRISFIYRWRGGVDMCFAYGSDAETRRGRGEVIQLRVEVVRPAVHPEGLSVR